MLGFTPLASAPLADSGFAGEVYSFAVNEGAFTLSGQDVVFNKTLNLDAQAGLITLSLQGAAKLITEFVPDGQFTVSGNDVTFFKALNIDAVNGSFSVNGQNVDLFKVLSSGVTDGNFTLVGNPIDFGFSFQALAGSFTLTGQEITEDITDAVASGSFSVTFQDADVTAQRNFPIIRNGSFSYQGFSIVIRGFFDVDPLPQKNYIEQTVLSETWSDATAADADTWSNAIAASTPTFTEVTVDNTETWDDAA